jgi:putative methylase
VQKRLARKLDLELLLSQIAPNPAPAAKLEQYTIPTDVAATMLYIAAYVHDDILNKAILDLGCGTGRLALGAAFLGAREVVGVDVDRTAVRVASECSLKTCLQRKVQWVVSDIDVVHGKFDTVLQNPPYGGQTRGADRKFLEIALKTGRVVYSLHKGLHEEESLVKSLRANPHGIVPVASSPFLAEFVERHGGKIKAVYAMVMAIPHMFSFHTKTRHEFVVDLYVIEKK